MVFAASGVVNIYRGDFKDGEEPGVPFMNLVFLSRTRSGIKKGPEDEEFDNTPRHSQNWLRTVHVVSSKKNGLNQGFQNMAWQSTGRNIQEKASKWETENFMLVYLPDTEFNTQ